jgi:predicted dithiol-disulfide oxidoreductase (DUF899 family)
LLTLAATTIEPRADGQSSADTYNRDYHGEDDQGAQLPMINVFARRKGRICHTRSRELHFVAADRGQNARRVDLIWPSWNRFDPTSEGRRTTWNPKLSY